MRTTTMTDGDHGALLAKLLAERVAKHDAMKLIERNAAADWKGVPTASRAEQEERLHALRWSVDNLGTWIEAMRDAPVH